MAKKRPFRTNQNTIKPIKEFLPKILTDIDSKYARNPKRIIDSWPEMIGPKVARMTQVVSYDEGVLKVKVNSSTLYSILRGVEKKNILMKMQNAFSIRAIRDIIFVIG